MTMTITTVENKSDEGWSETCVDGLVYVDLPDKPYSQVPGFCVTRYFNGIKRQVSWLLADRSFRTGRWPGKQYYDLVNNEDGSPPYYAESRTEWYWDDGKNLKRVMTYRGKKDGCRGMPGIEEIVEYDTDGLLLLHRYTIKGTFTMHEAHFRPDDELEVGKGEDKLGQGKGKGEYKLGEKGDKLGETIIYL